MERTLSPDSCSFMNYSDDNSLPYPPDHHLPLATISGSNISG